MYVSRVWKHLLDEESRLVLDERLPPSTAMEQTYVNLVTGLDLAFCSHNKQQGLYSTLLLSRPWIRR